MRQGSAPHCVAFPAPPWSQPPRPQAALRALRRPRPSLPCSPQGPPPLAAAVLMRGLRYGARPGGVGVREGVLAGDATVASQRNVRAVSIVMIASLRRLQCFSQHCSAGAPASRADAGTGWRVVLATAVGRRQNIQFVLSWRCRWIRAPLQSSHLHFSHHHFKLFPRANIKITLRSARIYIHDRRSCAESSVAVRGTSTSESISNSTAALSMWG